jgi:hypothetical protein
VISVASTMTGGLGDLVGSVGVFVHPTRIVITIKVKHLRNMIAPLNVCQNQAYKSELEELTMITIPENLILVHQLLKFLP